MCLTKNSSDYYKNSNNYKNSSELWKQTKKKEMSASSAFVL